MNRALFIFLLFILEACSGNSNTSDKIDSAIRAVKIPNTGSTNTPAQHQSANPWYGKYEYYLPGPNIGGVNIGWDYTILYNDNECTFSGDGYQTGFKYKCDPVYNDDTLYLKETECIGGIDIKSSSSGFSTMIIKVGNEYYFQSKAIADEGIEKPTKNGYKLEKLK